MNRRDSDINYENGKKRFLNLPRPPPPPLFYQPPTNTREIDDNDGDVCSFCENTFGVICFPMRLFCILLKFSISAILIPFQILWFVVTNFKFVFIMLLLWVAGYSMFNNYGVIISNIEYINRCIVWNYWETVFRDMLEMIRDIYDKAICWTNALGLMNRLLNVNLLINALRDCGKDPPFKFYTWLRIIGNIVVHLIQDTLQWSFSKNVLDSAFPGFTLFEQISAELIPYTTNGLICLCKDTRIIFNWSGRILNSVELDCIGHQLMNASIGAFQTVVNFILDLLKLILFVVFGSGTMTDVRDTLLGIIPGDVVMPNLSKVNIHERVNSASVYLGEYVNVVFMITYCTVTSEIDARGNSTLSEPLYQTCISDPKNKPQLFCVIGIIISSMDRFLRLQHTLLWHMPQILYETFTQPTGPRYIIDIWFEIEWDIFFDTLRDPLPKRSYAVSLNYPPIVPGTNISSIIWPDDHLYGPPVKLDCHLLNNSRFEVPCEQCPVVSEVDGETCACETASYLDSLTEPIINITIWGPSVCCLIPRVVRAGIAGGRFAVGTVIHVINFDRLGTWLADQNHYDIFFTEVAGEPYVVGGVLVCIRNIVVGFDARLRCFVDLIVKPAKFLVEVIRSLVIAAVRLINTILNTPEPGFEDYVCITNATNCIDLERMLSHLRRTRIHIGFDPTFPRTDIVINQEPAFIDCVCYWLNFVVLQDFLVNPPPKLPDLCCVVNYGFRLLVEFTKFVVEIILAFLETFISIFDSARPFTVVVVEWAACISVTECSNIGDIASDAEDFLNCPCEIIFNVEDILGPPKRFYCICDILSALVQTVINALRAGLLAFSSVWDMLYCIGNGWPLPHCGNSLYSRIVQSFAYLDTSFDSISGAVGGIGCILGLPWVGFKVDCLGTTYTSPLDYPPCHNSQNMFGPGQFPCTMSDRLSQLFSYLFKLIVTVFKFVSTRLKIVIAIGFTVTGAGTLETTISGVITEFFLSIGEPLFGKSNLLLNSDFEVQYNSSWPNTTGINVTKLNSLYVNTTGSVLGNWTFQPPPSNVVYGKTFNYTSISGLNETTGLVQSIGLTINCLMGLPTVTCKGPLWFNSTHLDGTTGCLGDLLIAAGNALRDVYTVVIEFIGNGLLVLERLFTNPALLGDAIISFIRSFFKIIFILVKNAQIIVDAIVNVIVEVARFVLGSGVADMLAFFLNIIADVISVFIAVIEFLLAPLINKRYVIDTFVFQYEFELKDKYPSTLKEAYLLGFDTYFDNYKNNSFFYNTASQEKWMNHTYWSSYLRTKIWNDTDGSEKRQFNTQDAPPDVLWARVRMEDFGMDQINEMTDDTMCKKIMTNLNALDRFSGMDLSQESMWRACFFAFSLPNEIYGYTGGTVNLKSDMFYNPTTFLTTIKDGISLWQDYSSFRSQNAGSMGAGGGSYTEVIPVPQDIMSFAENQLAIQEVLVGNVAASATSQGINGPGTVYVNASDTISSIIDPSLSDLLNMDIMFNNNKRNSANFREGSSAYFKEISEKLSNFVKSENYRRLFRKGHPSYFQDSVSMMHGEHECLISDFEGVRLANHESDSKNSPGVQYCVDTGVLYGGFTLYIDYPKVSDSERDIYLKSLILKSESYTWDKKRGLIDSSSGIALDQTLIYNQYIYDKPNSPKYNPFFGTHLTIYTSLAGHMVLNISKVGYLIPVIDGKIALTHANMSFLEYMQRNEIDTNPNLAIISSYEHHELDETKASFLRLNAKNAYLNYLVTKNYTEFIDNPDILSQERLTDVSSTTNYSNNFEPSNQNNKRYHAHQEEKKYVNFQNKQNNEKESMRFISSWLQKIENIIAGKTHNIFKYLDDGPQFRVDIGSFLASAVKGIVNNYKVLKCSYNDPSVTIDIHLPNRITQRKRNLDFINLEHISNFMGEYKKNSLNEYIENRNVAFYAAKKERDMNSPNIFSEFFTEHVPGLFQHLFKSVNAYFNRGSTHKYTTHLSPNDTVWKYDHETSSLREILAENAFLWEVSEYTDNVPKVVDSFFYAYGGIDEVRVLHTGYGKYSTYNALSLRSLPKITEENLVTPNDKRYWTDTMYTHPRDHILHRMSDFEFLKRMFEENMTPSPYDNFNKRVDENVIRFAADVNYYEYHYMSDQSAKTCLNDIMWVEYLKISPLGEEYERTSKIQYEQSLIEHEKTGKPLDVIEVYKCYRKLGISRDHPHQIKYGKTLRGKSLYEHRFEMLGEVKDTVIRQISEKLNWDTIRKNVKKVYLDPWIKIYRDTIELDKKIPTITGPLILYEKIRRHFFGLEDKSYAIPDIILAEMGHSVIFFEDIEQKKRSVNQNELYDIWYLEQSELWKDPKNLKKRDTYGKRSHFPPLVDICLPRNASDPSSVMTTCLNCRGCTDQHCAFCSDCYNCTPGLGGYDCSECGSCRVGPTSNCVGGCYQCTDCLSEATCLDCKIVQVFITGGIDIVNFCVETQIYNNTSVILKPIYNDTNPYITIPYNSSSSTPTYSSYGFGKILQYLTDTLFYYISKLIGIDIYASAVAFLKNFLLDPFVDRVGIGYVLYYKLNIPFLSRCNRDIHLMCTFGTGLRNALIITSILMFVIIVGLFFNLGIFGMIFSVSGLPHLFVVMVATFAWHWNLACAAEPVLSLFTSFGLSILVFPMLPECMLDEIFDLFNSTITQCSSWLPAGLTTDNVTCPTSCDVLVNITDCSQYGFYGLPTTIGYAAQRFVPDPLNFWLNDYLNRTCLVRGLCPFGLSWGEGILHPFFEVDYSFLISNNTVTADACFNITSFGFLMSAIYIPVFILLVYLIWSYLELLILLFFRIISLPPISWCVPKTLRRTP